MGRPLIVVSIPIRNVDDISKVYRALDADMVELRVDYHEDPLSIDYTKLPREKVVATLREFEEGGVRKHPHNLKVALLKNLRELGIRYDVELRFAEMYGIEYDDEIISIHILGDPIPLDILVEKIRKYTNRAFAVKIAVKPFREYRSYLVKLLELGENIAVMPMSENPLERIAYALLGSKLIYSYLDEPTAQGQMHYRKLKEIFAQLYRIEQVEI